MHGERGLVEGGLRGDLAEHPRDRPLQRAHSRLAGVLAGEPAQRLLLHRDVGGGQAGLVELAGQQVVTGDRDLLVLGVAVERHDLHAVEQRAGDGLQDVGGRQEEHVRQVELHLQVVVAEGVVLRGVEDLQQRRRGVAAVVGAHLVDLVQQDDGVHAAGLADGAHDAAGERADVGAPVAADLGLVADAAEGDPDELPAHGAGDRLTERGLADPGRPGQREDGAAAAPTHHAEPLVGAALAHRQVLHDAVLDVVQAGVVGVEHGPGGGDVVGVLGALVPRNVEHRVEPGADPAALGRLVGGALELVDLLERRLPDLLRQVGRLDAGAVVLLLGSGLTVQLGQLLAYGRELLAEQELALLLLHALLDVLADRLRDVQLCQVLAGPVDQQGEAFGGVGVLQELELLGRGQPRRVAGAVGEHRGVLDLVDGVDDLPGAALLHHRGRQGLVLLGQLLGALVSGDDLHRGRLDPQGRAGAGGAGADAHPLDTAQDGGGLASGKPSDLLDDGGDAHRAVLAVDAWNKQHPGLALLRGGPGGVDGGAHLGVRQVERNDHAGEDDLVVERQHREDQALTHANSKG